MLYTGFYDHLVIFTAREPAPSTQYCARALYTNIEDKFLWLARGRSVAHMVE